MKQQPCCANCGRQLVLSRDPKRPAWLHRTEDFDPAKPIDCLNPEPQQ